MERPRPLHAQLIRDARKAKGWSLDHLAHRLQHPVTRSHLNDIEFGRRNPGVALMDDLAAALDLPADYFCWLFGHWPADLRDSAAYSVEDVTAAFGAFRAALHRGRHRKQGESDDAR